MDEAFKAKHLPLPLQDTFQFYHFVDPLRKELGCHTFRFPSVNLGVSKIVNDKEKPVTNQHQDTLNGTSTDNDTAATFSYFFRAVNPDTEEENTCRFWAIGCTRRAAENFQKFECLLADLKEDVTKFRDRVNRSYEPYVPLMGNSVKFETPEELWLPSDLPWKIEELGGIEYRCIRISTSYCREISSSAGLTITRRAYVKIQHAKKMMELLLVALCCGAWTKFYLAGIKLLESESTEWNGNLAIQLVSSMTSLFGDWRGGKYHRGRTTSVNFMEMFSNPEALSKAANAMFNFLTDLESTIDLTLPQFKDKVAHMTDSIPGIGLFYGQNLALHAACAGIILKRNAHHGTCAFPVDGRGSQREALRQRTAQEAVVANQIEGSAGANELSRGLETLGLESSPEGFMKTTRLFCQFCGLKDQRPNWAECGLCDGCGRSNANEYFDTLFDDQSLFWLFNSGCGNCIARKKKWIQCLV